MNGWKLPGAGHTRTANGHGVEGLAGNGPWVDGLAGKAHGVEGRAGNGPWVDGLAGNGDGVRPADTAAGLGALVAMLAANLSRMLDSDHEVVPGSLLSRLLEEDPARGSCMLLAYTTSLLGVADETAKQVIRRLGAAIEFTLSARECAPTANPRGHLPAA